MALLQHHYVYLTLLLCYINKCVQGVISDPCINYTSLPYLSSRNPNYVSPWDSKKLCDRLIDERWYRTEGSIMTTKQSTFGSCGTMFPIWLADSFPPYDGLEYDRKSCIHSFLGKCSTVLPIKIKNCGTFFVYYLVSTRSCPAAYCFTNDTADTGVLAIKEVLNKYKEVTSVLANKEIRNKYKQVTSGFANKEVLHKSKEVTSVTSDPCINYTSLPNLSTRNPNYVSKLDSVKLCDRLLDERWYRTDGSSMTTKQPTFGSCGTMFPIWLADSFPPNDGLEYDRKACIHSFLGKCSTVLPIKIKNCGTFFVYYLVSTRSCPAAYCFTNDTAETGVFAHKEVLNKDTEVTSVMANKKVRNKYEYKEVTNDLPDPCNDFTDLPRMQERKLAVLQRNRRSKQICDRYLKEKWYKSDGSVIATSPRRLMRCGTKYPIWLADLLPEHDGREHASKVCMKYKRSTCYKSWNIKVKNCGNFYVYSLNATEICPSAYCFVPQGLTSIVPKRHRTTFASMMLHHLDPCLNYKKIPKLKDRDLSWKRMSVQKQQLCDGYLEPAWYIYPKGNMVTAPPAIGDCGTTFPIWLKGNLPPNDTLEHTLTACKVTPYEECAMKQNIKVKNCGKFYVYFLIPTTSCPSSYCFERRRKAKKDKKMKNKVKINRGQMLNNSIGNFQQMKNDPCYNNVPLPNLKARRSCRHLTSNVTPICDRYLKPRWYKVEGTTISTDPPPVFKCGTQLPMWLADPLPPRDGIEHSLTTCGVSFMGQCTRTTTIKVKNCGKYFVYYLVPTSRCPSAYCFASCSNRG